MMEHGAFVMNNDLLDK